MAGLLHKLQNNEAILLMYLADELPTEDHCEVERMLATDPALRQELDRLRSLEECVALSLRQGDAAGQALAADEARIRRAMRDMRRHQLDTRLQPVSAERAVALRRWPAWSYPLAAAAAAIFLFIGLWGLDVIDLPESAPIAGQVVPPDEDEGATRMADRMADELERSFAGGLDETEHRLHALQSEEDELAFSTL